MQYDVYNRGYDANGQYQSAMLVATVRAGSALGAIITARIDCGQCWGVSLAVPHNALKPVDRDFDLA